MEWLGILTIVLLCALIGLLSGIEVAFISVNKLSLELKKKQGGYASAVWGRFAENPPRFLAALVVSLNMLLVVYGLLIGDMLLPVWKWIERQLPSYTSGYVQFIRLFVEIVLSTLIILFSEIMVRVLFRSRKNSILNNRPVSMLASVFYWLFATFASWMVSASEWILVYVFNVKTYARNERFTKVDLEHFIQQSKHQDEEATTSINKELFQKALKLSEIKLRECLIPRKEVEGVDVKSSLEHVKEKFVNTKLSRLVVYENNIDNILGYVHHLDLFHNPVSLQSILHRIPTVPETMSATDLMNNLSRDRKSIAWVVDEFGGTAGIVTMEDLLEEIFGEIEDEYDTPETYIEKQLSETEFIFSGRMELDAIREKYKLKFEASEGAETLSGYIINKNQGIPSQKQSVISGDIEFTILQVSGARIETVKLKLLN